MDRKCQRTRSREEKKVILEAEENLSVLYSSKLESAQEYNGFRLRVSVPEMYALFTFKPLHNLQFGISKR